MIDSRTALKILKHKNFDSLGFREQLLYLLDWAALAPSTHNTQPWKFNVYEKDRICEVVLDESVRLTEADQMGKYSYISLGALITNFRYVANYYGILESIEIDDTDGLVVARIKLKGRIGNAHKEYERKLMSMRSRQNYRGLFDDRLIGVDILEKILSTERQGATLHISSTQDPKTINQIADLTSQGLITAYKNPKFRREVANHINANNSKSPRGMHGYTLRLNDTQSRVIPRLMKFKNIGPDLANKNYESVRSSKAVVVITGEGNLKQDWLTAGEVAEEIFINCVNYGVKSSIFVAPLEFGKTLRSLKKIMKISANKTPHLLFALGYSEDLMGYSHRVPAGHLTSFY